MSKVKKLLALIRLCLRKPGTLIKGMRYLRQHGMSGLLSNMKSRAAHEQSQQLPTDALIKFSVLMPVYNVEIRWLEKAINSVKNQNYSNWELCLVDDCSTKPEVITYLKKIYDKRIKVISMEKNSGISAATNAAAAMAEGDYLVLMDNDDEISTDALYEFKLAIDRTGADILYSDQDIIDMEDNHKEPLCKPDWSYHLLLSQMYIGHLLGFKRSLYKRVGGLRSECNGSQDYDLFLRMTEMTENIVHIPKILYSWRAIPSSTAANPESKPYAQTAGQKALQDHVDRKLGPGKAVVSETQQLFVYDVRYPMETEALVSVIIPVKDHVDLLRDLLDSIFEKTTYQNFEIIILNNNSEEKESYQYFAQVEEKYKKVRVEEASFPFNWSKLNNFGMEKAHGEVFLFMNNDMKIISPDWMERLVEKAILPDVGVVGGLLLYEDDTIQHAGVVVGMGGWAGHVFQGTKPVHYGSPFVSPMVTRNVLAVTGACMAISKKTIEAIGPFDDNFIICGSDVEICIRAEQQGFHNIYDPYVQLYHYESKSRDSYIPEIDFELSARVYIGYREPGDPYYNRQLDIHSSIPKIKES